MIFTTGGIKGGSGKTTIATNLAVYLSNRGRDVLLIDADDQASAHEFTELRMQTRDGQTGYTSIRQKDKEVRSEVLKLAKKFDDIVIDTGGRDTISQRAALSVTDIYLVPFFPRTLDLATLEKVEDLISDMQISNQGLKAFSFVNRADAKGSDNNDAAEILRESELITHLDTPLVNRKSFGNAITYGLGIFELKPADEKAQAEFLALYNEIFNSLGLKPY